MRQILFALMIFTLISCEQGKQDGSGPREWSSNSAPLIREYIIEKDPSITESSGIEQVFKITTLLHTSPHIRSDDRINYFAPEEQVWALLNDDSYGVICGGWALATMYSLRAFGYESRNVQLFSSNPRDNHIVTEVKIDGEWVAIDTTFNIVFVDKKGDLLSYKELKERFDNGEDFLYEYAGETQLRVDDYYMPYTDLLINIRALPVYNASMPELSVVLSGEERY